MTDQTDPTQDPCGTCIYLRSPDQNHAGRYCGKEGKDLGCIVDGYKGTPHWAPDYREQMIKNLREGPRHPGDLPHLPG